MPKARRKKPHDPAKAHDQRSRDLLRNAEVATVEVDNPLALDPGEKIVALRSLRNDPLGRLHSHHQIDEAQYQGGRAFQNDWEKAERGPRFAGRGRAVLGAVLGGLFFLLISLRGTASFYTEYLWFQSMDLGSVFRTALQAKLTLTLIGGLVFFALCWGNLSIAERMAPAFRPSNGDDDLIERYHEIVGRRAGTVRLRRVLDSMERPARGRRILIAREGKGPVAGRPPRSIAG